MDAKSRKECLNEASLLQRLHHPHIVRLVDSFMEGNDLYLVLELADGGDLHRTIHATGAQRRRFDEADVWRYAHQLVSALAHMHANRVMHRGAADGGWLMPQIELRVPSLASCVCAARIFSPNQSRSTNRAPRSARADIKPTNVFLTTGGDVKLGDLGLGRALSSRSAQADSLVGTPFYMSPEVIENQAYSYASDMWQLGCTLYEIAMLHSPFCMADGGGDAAGAGMAGAGQAAVAAATAGGNANLFAVAQRILACDYPPVSEIYTAPLRQLVHSMLQRDAAARPTAAQVEEAVRAQLSQGLANYEDLGVIGRGALSGVLQ